MTLTLSNIAKVAHATVVVDGLTVIIGENNNGKSTIGKVLYSLFHSICNMEEVLQESKLDYVLASVGLDKSFASRRLVQSDDFTDEKVPTLTELRKRSDWYYGRSVYSMRELSKNERTERAQQLAMSLHESIKKVRDLPESVLLNDALSSDLARYFHGQFLPNFTGLAEASMVVLQDVGADLSAYWNSDKLPFERHGTFEGRAWFVETPLVLDALGSRVESSFRLAADPIMQELTRALALPWRMGMNVVTRRIVEAELAPVYERLGKYVNGDFSRSQKGELELALPRMVKPLNVGNLSMGMKMLALLRLMLDENLLKAHDTLILDEPENHLHPELQVVFADVLVLLREIYGLRVLVTTHSPYFLQAIELADQRLSVEKHREPLLKVYQPKCVDDYGRVDFCDITGDTSSMYRRFAQTMRELDFDRAEIKRELANRENRA